MEYEEVEEELGLDMGDCIVDEEEDSDSEDQLSEREERAMSDPRPHRQSHQNHHPHQYPQQEEIGPPDRESRAFSVATSVAPVDKLLSMVPRNETFFVLVWGKGGAEKLELVESFFEGARSHAVRGATWTAFQSALGGARTEIHVVYEDKGPHDFFANLNRKKKEKEKTVDLLWYCTTHTGWRGRSFSGGDKTLSNNATQTNNTSATHNHLNSHILNDTSNVTNNFSNNTNNNTMLFDTQLNVGEEGDNIKRLSEYYPIMLVNFVATGEDINRELHRNAVKRCATFLSYCLIFPSGGLKVFKIAGIYDRIFR